jgi:hypothetical protein
MTHYLHFLKEKSPKSEIVFKKLYGDFVEKEFGISCKPIIKNLDLNKAIIESMLLIDENTCIK